MCDWCSDLRNVEPAKYISCVDSNSPSQAWLNEQHKLKRFVYMELSDDEVTFYALKSCPVCGHVFTEEDYDNYF